MRWGRYVLRPSVEQFVLLDGLRRRRGAQHLAQPPLPQLDVEVVLALQGAPRRRRQLMPRREQLGDRLPERLRLEAPLGGAHVLEDALLGARRDDRLRAPLDEDVGPPLRAPLLLDRHQSDDRVGAPVLAVAEKDHPVALDVHGASGASSVVCPPRPAVLYAPAKPGAQPTERAHGFRRFRMSSRTTRSIFPSIRTRTS